MSSLLTVTLEGFWDGLIGPTQEIQGGLVWRCACGGRSYGDSKRNEDGVVGCITLAESRPLAVRGTLKGVWLDQWAGRRCDDGDSAIY